MNMNDVVKAVNYMDNGNIHKRFENQIEKLNRLQSLTYVLEAISALESCVREYEGSTLKYDINVNDSYPKGIDLSYEVDGHSDHITVCPIDYNNYSVLDFIDSIKDNELQYIRNGQLVVDSMFKIKLMQQILGKKLFEEYCEKSFELQCYV